MNARLIFTIALRDFKSYFSTPLGSILIATFFAITGLIFYILLQKYLLLQQDYFALGRQLNYFDINSKLVQPILNNINSLLMFFIPLITMRSLSEERRLGTIQLLLTSPISSLQIALGKLFSCFAFVALLLTLTFIYPLILIRYA
ncbi:ABC transporter permease, partial [Bdellovibrionota bacterium]